LEDIGVVGRGRLILKCILDEEGCEVDSFGTGLEISEGLLRSLCRTFGLWL